MKPIPFTRAYSCGKELEYIQDLLKNKKQLSGNGEYTQKCHRFFEARYGVKKCLLTTSCTDALEMAAILLDIKPGDEVIVPSFTFVSTANAFMLRGAKLIFADSKPDHPNISVESIKSLITNKTKAIVPVHYGGMACDMDPIMQLAQEHGLFVVEDAAQAIESDYQGRQLGTIGHLSAFSFHDTKNISCGEGGALFVNDERFLKRSEIIWEKGTNRNSFIRGEVNKYGWVDIGSSFLPSELNSAYLLAQLEAVEQIQGARLRIWDFYDAHVKASDNFHKPQRAFRANAHNYFLKFTSAQARDHYMTALKEMGIRATFHYLSLHSSDYVHGYQRSDCPNSESFAETILRLPLYNDMSAAEMKFVAESLNSIRL